ncbi:hypothetical protein CSPX01_14806 [Colletotrichum filicis]|nr:hypothetical protein CSPX01_14806 [Colletotrichum filicis]
MSDRDGTWAPVVKSIAHGGPGYGEGEYRWWGGWGRKIEPKRWQQQYPRGPSRNFDEDADDNFHAAPWLEEPENGAKDDDG